jgi:hypothetical protein
MNAKLAAGKSGHSLNVDWSEEVFFAVPVKARLHTLTFLQAAPMTVDYAELPLESTDCRTQTGNTEFIRREIPPAEAA